LKYLNSYLLCNNKEKYYILKVLMFIIISKINNYKINELIYILHIYKNNKFLNPFLIAHIINKLSLFNINQMTINEFVFMLDTLNVPLLITNKFINKIGEYINKNIKKFNLNDYFIIGYFLAKNNLYNQTVFDSIAHFYEYYTTNRFINHMNSLSKWDENVQAVNSVRIENCDRGLYNERGILRECDIHSNENVILNDNKVTRMTNCALPTKPFLPTSDNHTLLFDETKEIHKHLFILSKYGYRNVNIYNNIFKIIILKCTFLKPLEVCSILKSCKNLNYYNSFLFQKLSEIIRKNISQFKINILLDCLNSLCYFNYKDNYLITKILIHLPRNLSSYTPNDFIKLLFFMNNFLLFSNYFILLLNEQILKFSACLSIQHLILLLEIFSNQNV
ncbi:conserved protein, unknown function, partial [Hepatocystis sp. ex Piliocolobus tephrosceles]